jgi:two-component system response regulator YesN
MYNVLLVDDEIFAVKGIVSGVDWASLEIDEVYEAYHAKAAKERLLNTPIDVMVCDIEMSEENGLELVNWVKKHRPDVVAIFLTCHADFSFAQKAVQLGSYDYLLKPVMFSDLEQVLRGALDSIQEKREAKETSEQLQKYHQMWQNKRPALIERFWQDLLSQKLLPNETTFQTAHTDYQLPIASHPYIQMILISVEQWEKPFSARDEEIMGFALRNAAEEIIIGSKQGQVVEDHRGNMVVLIYRNDTDQSNEAELQALCQDYLIACNQYFYCRLSCYIGETVSIVQIMKSYHELLDWEYRNVLQANSVLFFRDFNKRDKKGMSPISLMDWTEWFEQGDQEQFNKIVDETLDSLKEQQASIETLEAFYHSFLQVIYYVLHRKGIHAQMLYKDGTLSELSAVTKSLSELRRWMKGMIATVIGLLTAKRPSNSIVQRLQEYIANHLHEDFSREDLASYVFLNEAYISRLFRKETGFSLSDYILQERMKKAAELLKGTNESVSQVAVNLGFGNFSYFARMFKRVYGVTPHEFRKK